MRRPRHVKFEVKDEVAEITLNRPQARNALSPEMTEDFDVCIAEVKARQGNGIHAVLLTGEGNTCCAGGDVTRLNPALFASPQGAVARPLDFNASPLSSQSLVRSTRSCLRQGPSRWQSATSPRPAWHEARAA